MERNTLIAIILSVALLFFYQVAFVPPKHVDLINNAQNNVEQVVNSTNSAPTPVTENIVYKTTEPQIKPVDFDIKSPNAVFSYTNVGGTLHKINFVGNKDFPITDVLGVKDFGDISFNGQRVGDKTVLLIHSDKNLEIKKTYQLSDNNLIKVRMEIKNMSEISILNNLDIKAFQIDESNIDVAQNIRDMGLYEYSVYSNGGIFRKDNASNFLSLSFGQNIARFLGMGAKDIKNFDKTADGNINWVGFRDHYNALIIKPKFETKGYIAQTVSAKQLNVYIVPQDITLGPGKSAIYDFDIYAGPQNPWIMKKYNETFEKIIVFSKYPIYNWPAKFIYYSIPILHNIFRSWGIVILMVGILFYTAAYPLTIRSLASMRKIQEVQPKIKALQDRYKNDPQKAQTEIMEIYRREKINPLGGCLPFLIQMPFFYALYQVMYRAQYFQGQSFLWIKDLSQPDRLFIFQFNLPIIGNELNILPIITGLLMFLQQKFSSKNMVVSDEQQAMQQRMTMYFMPVLMVIMFYRFTSSWGLYFVSYYTLTTIVQWKLSQKAVSKSS